jgi:membrane-associated phospholipid phosphatase
LKNGIAGAAFAVALLGYVALAVLAHAQQWFFFDPPITHFVQGFRTPLLDTVMEAISYPGYPPQFLFFFGALLVVFLFLKLRLEAAIMVLGLAGVGGIGFVVKPLVHRLRPPSSQVWVADPTLFRQDPYSFTAGHVHTYMVVVGWSIFLAITLLPKTSIWRRVVVAAGLLFLLLMGFARFYLGDHWFSDVAGAYVLGGLWIGFETLAYGQVRKRWPDKLRPRVARA